MEKTIIKEAQKCKITIETPYDKIEGDSYVAFIKQDGKSSIEANNVDLVEIMTFYIKLGDLIKKHGVDIEKLQNDFSNDDIRKKKKKSHN